MAKGYWIAHVDVQDAEQYRNYIEANAAPFKAFGARFLVRNGDCQCREGAVRERQVVLEFPTYQSAIDCYDSQEYQKARKLRNDAAWADLVIVEGYDHDQE